MATFADYFTLRLGDVSVKGRRLSLKELRDKIFGSGVKLKVSTTDGKSRLVEQWNELRDKNQSLKEIDGKQDIDLLHAIVDEISDKLVGEENAGTVLNTLARLTPTGNGATTEKYFTIEKVDNNISGGEQLADYESGANIISYAMEVHPSLIGATPGKNSNSLSGSNQRELFLMKQALSKPMLARALRPFNAIKKINNWPTDYTIAVPEFVFTTLDEAKSGKKESQNDIAK